MQAPPKLTRSDQHFKILPKLPLSLTVDTIKDKLRYPDTNNNDYIKFNNFIDKKTPNELMTFYNSAKRKTIGNIRYDIKKAMSILKDEPGLETDPRSKSIGQGPLSHLVDDDDDDDDDYSTRVLPSTSEKLDEGGRRKSKKHKRSKSKKQKQKKSRRKHRKSRKY